LVSSSCNFKFTPAVAEVEVVAGEVAAVVVVEALARPRAAAGSRHPRLLAPLQRRGPPRPRNPRPDRVRPPRGQAPALSLPDRAAQRPAPRDLAPQPALAQRVRGLAMSPAAPVRRPAR
jgi:hypothetical protein